MQPRSGSRSHRQLSVVVAVLVVAGSLAGCGRASSRHPQVRRRDEPSSCDFVANPAFAPPTRSSEPPGSTADGVHARPLRTDPRLGIPQLLLAGKTGAWLVGSENAGGTNGQAIFINAASGRETRTCDVPMVQESRAAAWGDRLVVVGLDCSRCSTAVPTITVLDERGAVVFTWRAKQVEDRELFGAEIIDLGDSAAVIIEHGRRGRAQHSRSSLTHS